MFRNLLKISLIALLVMNFACEKGDNSSGSGGLSEATKIISDANTDLKEVKQIYKDNQGKVAELKAAIESKQVDNVKKMAGDLVKEIDKGVKAGENAVKKIEEAQKLNITPTYKKYLEMKQECLEKQLGAFEYRRDAADILAKEFGGTDKAKTDTVIAEFKEKEKNFQRLMNEGLELSQDANDFAKDSEKKAKKPQ